MWDKSYQTFENLLTQLIQGLGEKILEIAGAILFLYVGFIVSKRIFNFLDRRLQKTSLDSSLRLFTTKLVLWGLRILIVVSAAGVAGVQTSSFIAALGAAGIAIGLALQGSLSNIAGSFLILFFRPFKVGDTIIAQGQTGEVTDISFFTTKLRTLDFQTIYLPNGPLANGPIQNQTQLEFRRIDFVLGIGYDDNIENARQVIINELKKNPKILFGNHKTYVAVSSLASSSVNLTIFVWIQSSDYYEVYYWLNENIKTSLDRNKISIPYQHQVLHIKTSSN